MLQKLNFKPGFKFNEHELKGVPIRIVVGARDLKNNIVELARRDTLTKSSIKIKDIPKVVDETLIDIQKSLYNKALIFRNNKSIHLEKFLNFPDLFRNEALNNKWQELIKIRNICNISIEEKRANKEIGSSLEADLNIHLDKKLEEITKNIDFSELCIKSKAQIYFNEKLETSAQTTKAKGTKCTLCWKISENACNRTYCPKNT